MAKTSDIEGTKEDNTMNIEGQGIEDAGGARQTGTDADLQARAGKPVRNPCLKWGHHPTFRKDDNGKEILEEVVPRVCRHCQQPY